MRDIYWSWSDVFAIASSSPALASSTSGVRAYAFLIPIPKWPGRLATFAIASSMIVSLDCMPAGGALVLGAFPVGSAGGGALVRCSCPVSFSSVLVAPSAALSHVHFLRGLSSTGLSSYGISSLPAPVGLF